MIDEKAIDDYLDKIYKNKESNKINDIKEEMKVHIIESAEDFINDGLTEEGAVKEAISNFDGGCDMEDEIYREFIKNHDSTKYGKISIIFLALALVSFLLGYTDFSQSFEMNQASNIEKNLIRKFEDVVLDKDINNEKSYKEKFDKIISENEFNHVSKIEIYSKITNISVLNTELNTEYKKDINKTKNIDELPDLTSNFDGMEEYKVYSFNSGKKLNSSIMLIGNSDKNDSGQVMYYKVSFERAFYQGIEYKISVIFALISVVIFVRYKFIENRHKQS